MRKFDIGKYDEAAAEFESAYEMVGAPEILYNIAQALRLDGKYERALLFYKNYLRRKQDAENRAEVESRITELEAKIADMKAHPELQPKAEPPPPALTAAPQQQPQPPPQVAAPVPPRPSAPPRWLLPASATAGGLGIAGLVVGVVLSVEARSASNDVESAARSGAEFTASLRDKQNAGKTFDTVAMATYVAGGVLTVAGAVGVGVALHKRRLAAAAEQAQTSWIVPVAAPRFAGVALGGRF